MGAGVGVGAGFFFFWWAGLVAGLQVGQALGCSGCLGLGSAVPAAPPPPHVPGHPTSICHEGVNMHHAVVYHGSCDRKNQTLGKINMYKTEFTIFHSNLLLEEGMRKRNSLCLPIVNVTPGSIFPGLKLTLLNQKQEQCLKKKTTTCIYQTFKNSKVMCITITR